MGCFRVLLLFHALFFASVGLLLWAVVTDRLPPPPDRPVLEDKWFGPGQRKPEDKAVRKFDIAVDEKVLTDLKTRLKLDLARLETAPAPLEDSNFNYGFPSTEVKKLGEYWLNKYDWRATEKVLNRWPHFKTDLDGLSVHFIHAKPDPAKAKGKKVLPLLMVHGWPGSVLEFSKILPLLTTPQPGNDFVFEVIAPSIPGYGWSSAPAKQDFHSGHCARIFKRLMVERLGFEQFYTQGGDWGSLITSSLVSLYPDNVYGTHLNMAFADSPAALFKQYMSAVVPAGWLLDAKDLPKILPLGEKLVDLLLETGYMHIQATKPDTIGTTAGSSPLALGTYIIEKFSTWTRREFKDLPDGGLSAKFTKEELIGNVMIYWVTNSITSSMRFYAENFKFTQEMIDTNRVHVDVPVGISNSKNEIALFPKGMLDIKYRNLVMYTDLEDGGHFLAFEEPALLAKEVFNFVSLAEAQNSEKKTKEEL